MGKPSGMDTEQQAEHRPMPGPGDAASQSDQAAEETGSAPQPKDGTDSPEGDSSPEDDERPDIPEPKEGGDGKIGLDRSDESQDFVDQSVIDFDPDEGLYSGTAVDGTTEIPGPHAGDGDEESVMEQAKEMAGDDPPESEATVGVLTRGQQKREHDSDDDSDEDSDRDERTPDSSDEQAYN